MPSRSGESLRFQHDRDRQPGRTAVEEPRHFNEPRHFDVRGPQTDTQPPGPHAGFDAELNPIDDEEINTHGSER